MQRVTISIDDDLAAMFDRLVKQKGYENRSEAVRDLVRKALGEEQLEKGKSKHCAGALSYVYDHHERQLASRLTGMQHEHHDVTVATMHAHLDHENCLETVILRGPTLTVVQFAQDVMAQTGVKHGDFHPIPMEVSRSTGTGHVHFRPHS